MSKNINALSSFHAAKGYIRTTVRKLRISLSIKVHGCQTIWSCNICLIYQLLTNKSVRISWPQIKRLICMKQFSHRKLDFRFSRGYFLTDMKFGKTSLLDLYNWKNHRIPLTVRCEMKELTSSSMWP